MPFPELNLKQAWLIPSAEALPNPNGTAPGWFVDRPDGRVIVALPGPPREMRPMWADHVAAAPRERGLGAEVAVADLPADRHRRVAGRRAPRRGAPAGDQPDVATYARVEAVDVRISAVGDGGADRRRTRRGGRRVVLGHLGDHVWATGETTWSEAHRRAARRARLDAGGGRDRDRRAASARCSGMCPGSGSTSRSHPTRRPPVAHGDDPRRR